MECCGPALKKRNVTAYISREELNVNELGNNVSSLVPYDYSSEEEQTVDRSKPYFQDDVNLDVKGSCSTNLPKSDSLEISKEPSEWLPSKDDFEDYVFDDEFCYDSFRSKDDWSDSSESYDMPRSPEWYGIWTTDEICDDSYCIDILKDYGCESCFLYRATLPRCFCAKLDKAQVKKLKGDSRILNVCIAADLEED